MPTTKGKVVVQPKLKRVALQLDYDFANYYIWFIQRQFKIKVSAPKHGPHISLALPKFDKKVNWKLAKTYSGRKYPFSYDPKIVVGGQTKDFRNFFVRIVSEDLYQLCKNINTSRTSNRFHVTIANTKGVGFVDWWPQMIELKNKSI